MSTHARSLVAPPGPFFGNIDFERLLGETSYLLLQDVDPHTLARTVYSKLCEYLPLDAYVHYLLAPDGSHLELASGGGKMDMRRILSPRLELGDAVCGTVAQTAEVMHIADVQQRTDEMTSLIRRLGLRAYTCQPLFARGRLIGTFSFGSMTRNSFYKEEMEILELVAEQISLATDRRVQNERILLLEREATFGRVTATLAHEINNPLDSLSNLLSLLRDELSSEEARNLLRTAEEEVAGLAETTRRTLDIARGGKHPPKQFMVDEFLGEIAANIKLPKGAPLESTLEPGLWVNVVPGELRQAVYNLLLNAAQFTPLGGKIVLSCSQHGIECVQIHVADQGPGIREESRSKIFQPYYTTRENGGTGLGLWASRALMQQYGGDITFQSDSSVRCGTVFTITLPSFHM
jgi:hypothetical protein